MKKQDFLKCPNCGSSNTSVSKGYRTIHNGTRQLFICKECNTCFSETRCTAMENIKPPISKVAAALKIRSEGASRFIVDQRCGKKDAALFKSVMGTVCKFVRRTGDLSFLSDGERRYGNTLFALCSEALQTGKRGRPAKVIPKGVRLRVKNKGVPAVSLGIVNEPFTLENILSMQKTA